jgi:hypothetical protein
MTITFDFTRFTDGSHQLLHTLTCTQVNAEVFVLVKDFEKLKRFRQEFPTAIFILLDLSKNTDLNKAHLRILPAIDCYLNFSGENFCRELSGVEEVSITR